jgi:hypothetical protein
MAVTSLTAETIPPGSYLLSWASDLVDPTFYVYRDGVLVATTQLTSMEVLLADEEAPVFEVLDDPDEAPAAAYPPFATLAWYPSPGAGSYRVDEYVSGAWVERATLEDSDAAGRGLPPKVVVVQQGGNFLNGTYTLEYVGTGGVHRWKWTDGTTTVEIYKDNAEWLLRLYDATHFVTYGSNLQLPEYPPPGEATSVAGSPWVLRLSNAGGSPKGYVSADQPTGNYFAWESRFLEDSASHRFRVVPVGQNGNEGTSREFLVLMVRIPDPPEVTYTYNGTPANTVTIAAA